MEVGLTDYLPFPVVLGRDLPVFWDLLPPAPICNMVVTRAKVRGEGETKQLCGALPFFDSDIETPDIAKFRKSRRQKRLDKIEYNTAELSDNPLCEFSPGFKLPMNIAQLQHEDGSLVPYLERAKQEEISGESDCSNIKERYAYRQGILYRQHGSVVQLVVPQSVRDVVLHLGHSIPWGWPPRES